MSGCGYMIYCIEFSLKMCDFILFHFLMIYMLLSVVKTGAGVEIHKVIVGSHHFSVSVEVPSDESLVHKQIRRDMQNENQTRSKFIDKHCINRTSALANKFGKKDERAEVVDLDGSITLPCHFCGDTLNITHEPKLWFKFKKIKKDKYTEWIAQEVKLDMHDDDRLNRVYVDVNHNLVLKDFQPKDVGSYFCQSFDKDGDDVASFSFRSDHVHSLGAATISAVWKKVSAGHSISFLHHVDIELPMRASQVSLNEPNFPRPALPLLSKKNNWVAYTEWMKWGNCSECGIPSKRERRGHCMVRKVKSKLPSKPKFLNEVFKFYPDGVPCHTSMFFNFQEIIDRRHETMVERCIEKCPHKGSPIPEIFDIGIIEAANNNSQVHIEPEKNEMHVVQDYKIEAIEGSRLILICPDRVKPTKVEKHPSDEKNPFEKVQVRSVSSNSTENHENAKEEKKKKPEKDDEKEKGKKKKKKKGGKKEKEIEDTMVEVEDEEEMDETGMVWFNNSKKLSSKFLLRETQGRVYVNDLGFLNITNVSRADTKRYTCWFNRTVYGRFHVKVSKKFDERNIDTHLWLLGASYVVNFFIFLGYTFVKHGISLKKVKQIRRKKRKKQKSLIYIQ